VKRTLHTLDEFADLIVVQSGPSTHLARLDFEWLKDISFAPPGHPNTQKTVDDIFKGTT